MATVKYVLTLDDKLSKGLKGTRENVQKTIAALHALNDAASGVGSGMATAGGQVAMSADQMRGASDAIREASKAAGLGAEQQAKLAEASKKAAAAAAAQREATKKARAEAKAAAAAARLEAKERNALAKALEQQRAADERVRLGKEQAGAVQELRIIDQTIAKLKERNELTEEELALLNRRKAQVRENLAVESGRAAELGTRIDRGFGARGTRRSPIAGGVFSTHVGRGLDALNDTNKALDINARNSKDAATAARALAVQLPDVFSQLAAGTPVMQVFTQQGLQVVQTLQTQTSLFGRLASAASGAGPAVAALGVVAAAVAAAGFSIANAYQAATESVNALSVRMRDAERDFAKARSEVVKTAAAFAGLRDEARESDRQTRVLLGTLTEEEADLERVTEAINRKSRAGILAASQAQANAQREVDAIREIIQSTETSTDQKVEAAKREKQAKAALAAATEVLNQRQASADDALFKAQDLLFEKASKRANDAEERKARAASSTTKRADNAVAQAERQARALRQLDTIARQAETSQLEGIEAVDAALQDQLDTIDALIKAQGRLTPQQQAAAARARGAVRGQAETQRQAIQAKEQEQANKAAADAAIAAQEAASSLADLLDTLGGDIRRDGLGSLLTGDVSGAIEAGLGRAIALAGRGASAAGLEGLGAGAAIAAGPVAAGVVGLKEVGELGAAGVEDLAEQTVDAIVAGIEALPEILVRVAPKIGVAIVTELIPALAMLPIEFARAIGQALRELFTGGKERRQDRRSNRQNRRDARRAERGFQSGTSMVERDGLHILHRGEAVVPTSGATTQPVLERVREQAGVGAQGPRIKGVTMEALILRVGQASTPYATFPGTPP